MAVEKKKKNIIQLLLQHKDINVNIKDAIKNYAFNQISYFSHFYDFFSIIYEKPQLN